VSLLFEVTDQKSKVKRDKGHLGLATDSLVLVYRDT